MTAQGHVTTASLKQAHKEDNREVFFYLPIKGVFNLSNQLSNFSKN